MALYSPTSQSIATSQSSAMTTRTGQIKLTLDQIKAGEIIGKATWTRSTPEPGGAANGSVRILVAFRLGNYYQFYFAFDAPSARSPRKAWKFAGSFGVYKGNYLNFEQAVDLHQSQNKDLDGARLVTRYPIGKKRLAQIIESISHPAAPSTPPNPKETEWVNKRMQNGRAGRALAFLRSK